jgi:hypothetical protein
LLVRNNATLTIEPGVTIQFTKQNGGLEIQEGSCITAVGTEEKHIQFVGVGTQKGTWYGVTLNNTNADNKLVYCDLLNAGSSNSTVNTYAALYIYRGSNASIQHCKITNGLDYGIALHSDARITAFDNNSVEGFENREPVYSNGALSKLSKFDMTSDFTGNTKPYIKVDCPQTNKEDVSLSQTSVPYYINYGIDYMNKTLTINEGVTLYMGNGQGLSCQYGEGGLVINGSVAKPVTVTRLPGTSYYWNQITYRTNAGHQLKNCIIEYGGNPNNRGMIELWDVTNLTMENVVVRNSYNYGILWNLQSTRVTHSNVTFDNNFKGNVYYNGQIYDSLDELP